MNLAILRNIPWREIIDWTPAVVAIVANKRRQPVSDTIPHADSEIEELRERVSAIESSQRAQVEAVAKMAEQGEKLAKAVHVLSARMVLLAWVAGGSLVLSLVLAGQMLLS